MIMGKLEWTEYMIEVKGACADARVFNDNVEQYALAQIQMLCDNETAAGSVIRVMPDVHPGKVGPVGLTMTITDKIIPNLIGVDIGCGMTCVRFTSKRIEYQKLDRIICEEIPSGQQNRRKMEEFCESFDLLSLRCLEHIQIDRAYMGIGTLGGGNHFIEVDTDGEENLYLVIHSGSRHLGVEVSQYYQNQGYKELKERGESVPQPMAWLEGELMEDYLHDLLVVQEYAAYNRECMARIICRGMKWKQEESFSIPHNYVEENRGSFLLRKGAVRAEKGDRLLIPVNMRDGIILGTGRGNPDWNCSGPHGAGRLYRRDEVKRLYTVNSFKTQMKGIYCSCIGPDTLDEAPFAYRGIDEILKCIEESVQVDKVLKPVYSFKAKGRK